MAGRQENSLFLGQIPMGIQRGKDAVGKSSGHSCKVTVKSWADFENGFF